MDDGAVEVEGFLVPVLPPLQQEDEEDAAAVERSHEAVGAWNMGAQEGSEFVVGNFGVKAGERLHCAETAVWTFGQCVRLRV
jgi:hypothetical protein